MLGKFVGRFWIGRAGRGVRGSVMPIFAVMSLPVLLSAGVGVDMTRLSMARSVLQSAANGAALAGATSGAAQSPSKADDVARTVATSYFNGVTGVPGAATGVTVSSLVVTPSTVSSSSYQVNVVATASMNTTFMKLANLMPGASGFETMPVSVHATANNTNVPGNAPQPLVNSSYIGSNAWDWNQAYIYPVPYISGTTTPDYASLPPVSQFYKIGDNCVASSTEYRSPSSDNYGGSLCNAVAGTPNNCSLQGAATSMPVVDPGQALAILTINMTSGLWTNGGAKPKKDKGDDSKLKSRDYGQAYGAVPGSCQVMSSAYLSLGQPPSQNIDASSVTLNTLNAAAISNKMISAYVSPYKPYNPDAELGLPSWDASVNALPQNNCALIIQPVDPNSLPAAPPGIDGILSRCFSSVVSTNTTTGDPASGRQFANLSCNQIAGRTFEYWFNDMGGNNNGTKELPVDPRDYNNLEFSVRCTGGTNTTGGAKGAASSTVSLLH